MLGSRAMQIIVLGAGAIGSLYGAKLAATNDVILIGRPDHVAAINSHGLRIEGLESDRSCPRRCSCHGDKRETP